MLTSVSIMKALFLLDLDDDVFAFAYSPYAWSLTHFNRPNYLFQLHKGKDVMCSCFGGSVIEPEDAGAEHAEKRGEWCEFMDKCCSSVAGILCGEILYYNSEIKNKI